MLPDPPPPPDPVFASLIHQLLLVDALATITCTPASTSTNSVDTGPPPPPPAVTFPYTSTVSANQLDQVMVFGHLHLRNAGSLNVEGSPIPTTISSNRS